MALVLRIGFIIIAHEAPGPLVELARTLTSGGDTVVIHYDLRSPKEHFSTLERAFRSDQDILLAPRIACGWGEYSLVEATINGLRTLVASGQHFDYVYLMSGADLPLKSIETLRAFLAQHLDQKTEFIQSYPMRAQKWIKAGLEKERFIYRHYFNERRHPVFFNISWRAQRALRLQRKPPAQIDISLGSQWWCLRWETCVAMLEFISNNPDVDSFFRTAWIPDECYFQTIIRKIVPPERIANHSLTYYQFNDYGKPVVYFDDHFEILRRQNFFFGRKAANSARVLRKRLLEVGRSGVVENIDQGKIGRYTMEYDAQRSLKREPSALFRSKGRPYNPPASDLPFLARNVLAIVTTSSAVKLSTGLVSPTSHSLVHGDLFGEHRIRFADERAIFGGYREVDIGERDTSPFAFLSNVVAAGPVTTGFYISAEAEKRLNVAEGLACHSNTAVLFLTPDSLIDSTLAEIDNRLLCFDNSRQLSSLEITNCISAALLSAQKLKQLSEDFSFSTTVWFTNGNQPPKSVLTPQQELPDVFSETVGYILESHAAWANNLKTHPLRGRVEDKIEHLGAAQLWSAARISPRDRTPTDCGRN